jgi:ABC-type transporter Mla MlaB component
LPISDDERMSTKTSKRKRAGAAAQATPSEEPTTPQVSVDAPAMPVEQQVEPAAAPASSDGPKIELPSNATVKDAEALKNGLLQWLDEPAPVVIDAGSVERVDTAVIQVLCAFVRDRAARGHAVTWRATQALLDAARLIGVGGLMALPEEAAA